MANAVLCIARQRFQWMMLRLEMSYICKCPTPSEDDEEGGSYLRALGGRACLPCLPLLFLLCHGDSRHAQRWKWLPRAAQSKYFTTQSQRSSPCHPYSPSRPDRASPAEGQKPSNNHRCNTKEKKNNNNARIIHKKMCWQLSRPCKRVRASLQPLVKLVYSLSL